MLQKTHTHTTKQSLLLLQEKITIIGSKMHQCLRSTRILHLHQNHHRHLRGNVTPPPASEEHSITTLPKLAAMFLQQRPRHASRHQENKRLTPRWPLPPPALPSACHPQLPPHSTTDNINWTTLRNCRVQNKRKPDCQTEHKNAQFKIMTIKRKMHQNKRRWTYEEAKDTHISLDAYVIYRETRGPRVVNTEDGIQGKKIMVVLICTEKRLHTTGQESRTMEYAKK